MLVLAAGDATAQKQDAGAMCVEPTEIMRRSHMEFILHQRDETVHRGIRTSKHSFAGCIECHSTNDDEGALVRHDDSRHFCAGCHVYAAVRIDCFECHTDRPQKVAAQLGASGALFDAKKAGMFHAGNGVDRIAETT